MNKSKIPKTCGPDSVRRKFGSDGFSFVFEPFPFVITVALVAPKNTMDFHKEVIRLHRNSKGFRRDVPKRIFDKLNPISRCNACVHYLRDDTLGLIVIDYTRADIFSVIHECDHLMTYMAQDGFIDQKNVFNIEFWAYTLTGLAKRIRNRMKEPDIGLELKEL